MADNNDTISNARAFVFGDVTSTLFLLGTQPFIHELGQFGIKVLVTLVLGAVGGIGGIVGKEAYAWYKAKRKNKTKSV